MQTLTTANVPAIGATVNATDYKGDVWSGEVTSRDWSFSRLLVMTVTVTFTSGNRRDFRIWADRDSFELA